MRIVRIGIREQLAAVVLVTALVPLAVLAIATWVNNQKFVSQVTANSLSLTASLKAVQITSDLLLIESSCSTVASRIALQNGIKNLYKQNTEGQNWTTAVTDITEVLDSGGMSTIVQVTVFSRNTTGDPYGILNVTSAETDIILPHEYPDGTPIKLGDNGLGYPLELYPNLTYNVTSDPDPVHAGSNLTMVTAFKDFSLNSTSKLLLGPLQINETFALVSLTLPIIDNVHSNYVLGYITVVASATFLLDVVESRAGLANTGVVLIVGPDRPQNLFEYSQRPATVDYYPRVTELGPAVVKYVFPPLKVPGQASRHTAYTHNLEKYGRANFTESEYPAVARGFSSLDTSINNASTLLTTTNENNATVAVGYARPESSLVDWLLIVEQSHSEAWSPIYQLRNIVVACVFGAIGLVLLFVVPFAHYSVRPIRRLREATKNSIAPPCSSTNGSDCSDRDEPEPNSMNGGGDEEDGLPKCKKKGFVVRLKHLSRTGRRKSKAERDEEQRRRGFRIPAKVQDRKHLINDELSDLTATFNAMTDELLRQYTSLESKVAARTQELEISKKAAEAANESKTLFIANISHELKTPLNGILGMCAVCMSEDDLPKIKRSLQVVYKSGDLLLQLLNDLLTFSKNQIGQQLSLEEKEFHLYDIKTQILTIFMQQVQEGRINFEVKFVGADTAPNSSDVPPKGKAPPALGPNGIGRLKDMRLWGDQHRILQVIINLVSNSLKFTPEGGKVSVKIRCLGEAEISSDGTRHSMGSQRGSKRSRKGSESNNSQVSRNLSAASNAQRATKGTALLINPMEPNTAARMQGGERSSTPPPPNAKTLIFQFEVTDTGPGIPASLQDCVFEPFVQADLGLSRKYGGTGLGLSICAQLATLMGGDIALVSTEGAGSSFKMRIPLKHIRSRAPSTSSSDAPGGSRPESILSTDESQRRTPLEVSSNNVVPATNSPMNFKDNQPRLVGLSQPFFAGTGPSPATAPHDDQLDALSNVAKVAGTKVRVLVAEDNLVNQEVVLRMLKLEDIYDVVVAKDGQEAYEMVKASMAQGQFFNLIFMDVQMPNLSGIESTRLIRQMGYSAPIVALTAFAEESNMKECYDSGMDMFLSKPIRRPALKQVLKKFATIPEEAEPATTPEKEVPEPKPIPTPAPPPAVHIVNGTAS